MSVACCTLRGGDFNYDDFMKTLEPDFKVRKLSEYSVEDLETLYGAILIAKSDDTGMTKDIKKSLDVWTYRVMDAIKEAREKQ